MNLKSKIAALVFACAALLFSACGGGGGGGGSEEVWPAPLPVTLAGVTVAADGKTVTINWIDPVIDPLVDEEIDHVEVGWTNGTASGSAEVAVGTQTYNITGLTAGSESSSESIIEYTISVKTVSSHDVESEGGEFTLMTFAAARSYYFIYTAADLDAVRGNELVNHADWDLTDSYILMADIDLTSFSTGEGWVPLGSSTTKFTGIFNGNGHVISNLVINRPGTAYQGLFGYAQAGGVYHLELQDVDVTGANYTAGIAGYNNNSIIGHCVVSGNITGGDYTAGLVGYQVWDFIFDSSCEYGTITGLQRTGGIVGQAEAISLSGCAAGGTITGTNYVGGIAGNTLSSPISDCSASAAVTGSLGVGGLVGEFYSGSSFNRMQKCSATGNVTGNNSVGGLIGLSSHGTVRECFATGNVTYTGINSMYFGGLIGRAIGTDVSFPAYTENCYATGNVQGKFSLGGLIGFIQSTSSTAAGLGAEVVNCYAIGIVTIVESGSISGGLVGENAVNYPGTITSGYFNTVNTGNSLGNSTSLADMLVQGTFSGWDFYGESVNGNDDIWRIDTVSTDGLINGGYPYLTGNVPH